MIVDTHVHVWEIDPPKYPVGPTSPNWSSYPDQPATADQLLAEMNEHGVNWCVLVQTSWSTWDNGYIADSVTRFPDRFVGHGLIDPEDPNNAEQVRYWVEERGLIGFRFHPMYYPNQKILLKPSNEPMWKNIADLSAIIQFHTRPEFAGQIKVIAQKYPHLKLIIDHLGYPDIQDDGTIFQPIVDLADYPNVYIKLSDVAGRSAEPFPHYDVHPFIERLLSAFGVEHTVWGTGFPAHHRTRYNWPTLEQELGLIREGLPFLNDDDKKRILGGTAAEIWSLS
jgi:predicted TIM-barrel fold metal-dependent hydrolase